MNGTSKKEKWTEEELDNLSLDEHDYLKRKSGVLFSNEKELRATLGKAISAMSNSGGGHIILGMGDDGKIDGVPQQKGRADMRSWLEQIIPHLVAHPINDFRVHIVQRSNPSRIPVDRDVIVVDVGDSYLAPHQCVVEGKSVSMYTYYYRKAGRSEPAPHFYLELLRNRIVNSVLELEVADVTYCSAEIRGKSRMPILVLRMNFKIRNVGRVAAYKWGLRVKNLVFDDADKAFKVFLGREKIPEGHKPGSKGIPVDPTILPGDFDTDADYFGIEITPDGEPPDLMYARLGDFLQTFRVEAAVATETSPGEPKTFKLPLPKDIEVYRQQILNQFK